MDWNAMAAPWLAAEAEMDAAHAPAKQGLMERAQLQNGQKVLDIGPGGGASLLDAADAVGPNGQVVGIEIAPPFVERALQRVPANVDVQVGDAATHHFEPAEFDAAISLFGVMFFTDPTAAFAHIRTALKPGAVLTFACWGPPQSNPWFSMPGGVATDVYVPVNAVVGIYARENGQGMVFEPEDTPEPPPEDPAPEPGKGEGRPSLKIVK